MSVRQLRVEEEEALLEELLLRRELDFEELEEYSIELDSDFYDALDSLSNKPENDSADVSHVEQNRGPNSGSQTPKASAPQQSGKRRKKSAAKNC